MSQTTISFYDSTMLRNVIIFCPFNLQVHAWITWAYNNGETVWYHACSLSTTGYCQGLYSQLINSHKLCILNALT